MLFPFQIPDDNAKEKNKSDIIEKNPKKQNDEVLPDPELLKKVVDDGIKELFSD